MRDDFEWNEALSESCLALHSGLLTLLAFEPNRSPKLIGTAFIIGAYGNYAVAVSAAHNIHEGVMNAQNPKRYRAPSTPPEFLPEISVNRQRLRAIYRNNGNIEACVIGSAVWDKMSDMAAFMVAPQNTEDKGVFEREFRLENVDPKVGDLVGMIGYGDMAITEECRDGDFEKFSMESRLVIRKGRVRTVYPDGVGLVKTKCIKTTIPIYNGMSGGPTFLMPESGADIVPFGLISHDPEIPIEQKSDRSQPGASIAACLPIDVTDRADGKRDIRLLFADFGFATNAEFDAKTK